MIVTKLDNLKGYVFGSRDLIDWSSNGEPEVPLIDDLRLGKYGALRVEGMKCPGLGISMLVLWFGRDRSIQISFNIDYLMESDLGQRLNLYHNLSQMVEKMLQLGKMEQSYLLFQSDRKVVDLEYVPRRESMAYKRSRAEL